MVCMQSISVFWRECSVGNNPCWYANIYLVLFGDLCPSKMPRWGQIGCKTNSYILPNFIFPSLYILVVLELSFLLSSYVLCSKSVDPINAQAVKSHVSKLSPGSTQILWVFGCRGSEDFFFACPGSAIVGCLFSAAGLPSLAGASSAAPKIRRPVRWG